MQNSNKISKNVLSLIIGRGLDLVLSFVSITLIARYLGVENYGIFTSLVAVIYILSRIIDFGLAPIVFRENSKQNIGFDYINNTISLRAVIYLLLFMVLNLLAFLFGMDRQEILLSNILYLNIIFSAKFFNFREILEVLFKVDLKMHYVMIFNISDNLLLLILILLMPYIDAGLTYVVICYVVANIPGFLLLNIFLRKKYNFSFKIIFSKTKWLVKESLPLFGYVILSALFQQADIIILKNFDSSYAAGIYGAATRLAVPLGIIPIAVVTTMFPIIVQNREKDESKNSLLILLVNKTLFLLSFTAALLITFKSKELVVVLFGAEFSEAAFPMTILFWAHIFIFFNNFSLNLLTAYEQQKYNFYFSILIVIVNFALIAIFIGQYSFTGTAMAKLGASLLGSIFLVIIYRRVKISYNFFSLRVFIWCLLNGAIILAISYLPLYLYLFLIIISILLVTWKIGFYTNDEIKLLLRLMNKEKWGTVLLKK